MVILYFNSTLSSLGGLNSVNKNAVKYWLFIGCGKPSYNHSKISAETV